MSLWLLSLLHTLLLGGFVFFLFVLLSLLRHNRE